MEREGELPHGRKGGATGMTTISDFDKKLLIFMGIFLLVIGLGAGVIYPVMEATQEASTALAEAELEKLEREQKVTLLPVLKEKKTKVEENLAKAQETFYSIMPSKDIDKLLTEKALTHSLVVTDLDISMPVQGDYASLVSYPMLLGQYTGLDSANAAEGNVYGGVYSADVRMTMTGSRDDLQAMLDELTVMEPKLRVSAFGWQQSSSGDSEYYTLSVSMSLYMYEDADTYAAMQLLEGAAGSETAAADEDDLTDELE